MTTNEKATQTTPQKWNKLNPGHYRTADKAFMAQKTKDEATGQTRWVLSRQGKDYLKRYYEIGRLRTFAEAKKQVERALKNAAKKRAKAEAEAKAQAEAEAQAQAPRSSHPRRGPGAWIRIQAGHYRHVSNRYEVDRHGSWWNIYEPIPNGDDVWYDREQTMTAESLTLAQRLVDKVLKKQDPGWADQSKTVRRDVEALQAQYRAWADQERRRELQELTREIKGQPAIDREAAPPSSQSSQESRNLHARVSSAAYEKLQARGKVGTAAAVVLEAWAAGADQPDQSPIRDCYDRAVDRYRAVRVFRGDPELAAMVQRAAKGALDWHRLETSLRRDMIALMAASLEVEDSEPETSLEVEG